MFILDNLFPGPEPKQSFLFIPRMGHEPKQSFWIVPRMGPEPKQSFLIETRYIDLPLNKYSDIIIKKKLYDDKLRVFIVGSQQKS